MTPLVGYPWDEVRRLGLPPADYAVFGSVPLLACGLIQEVSDLDLLARGAAWAKAQTLGEAVRAPHGDVVIQLPNRIDIFNGWLGLDADTIIDRAELRDGVKVARLVDVAHYKQLLRRPKDLEHLRLLGLDFAGL